MATTILQEFRDANMHRLFPLDDTCTGRDVNGAQLPDSFLVDCSINTATEPGDNDYFYIADIAYDGSGWHVSIGYSATGAIVLRSGRITAEHAHSSMDLAAVGSLDCSGRLYIGSVSDMLSAGSLSFDTVEDHAKINSYCVHYVEHTQGPGLSQLTLTDSTGNSVELTDDFTIRVGEGIDLSYSGDVLTITRQQAYDSAEDAAAALKAALGNPISSVNGLTGEVLIKGLDCVTVANGAASVTIDNPCSKPCCDSTDEDVTAAFASLEEARQRMLSYFEALNNNINAMQSRLASLIASRS